LIPSNMNRLQEKYTKEVVPELKKEFGITNVMAVPKVVKVVINAGVGTVIKNKEQKEAFIRDLSMIAGQVPSIRKARVSIASFSLRIGMPVGLAVTLRRDRMYSFLDRLFSVVLPRLRDFRGLARKSLDKSGNYTLGFAEHTVFPEIDLAKAATAHGLEVVIVTSSKEPKQEERLLELLGMPFEK